MFSPTQTLPASALLAALLSLAAPAPAAAQDTISIRTTRDAGGAPMLVVQGPAHANGLLLIGPARTDQRPFELEGQVAMRAEVQARHSVRFRTDASGSWSYAPSAEPAGLLVQAIFPATSAAASSQGVGGAPGAGYSPATPAVFCPVPVLPGDVVITEIQRAPVAVSGGDGEWFEVRNTTACDIDLEGWRITDGAGDFHFIGTGQGVIVPAKSNLVFGAEGDPSQNGGVPVDYAYSNVDLDELADSIVLSDATGTEMERVEWDASWPSNAPGQALSLEPGTDAQGNDLASNWCLAQAPIDFDTALDFGTPGGVNPSCACAASEDLPDGLYVDANCDGIDGSLARAVFVAKSGTPSGLGVPGDPLDTISAALALAATKPNKDHVYVSVGTYDEEVALVDGVSLWGGFDAADGWSRASDHVVLIHSDFQVAGGIVTLTGTNLVLPVVVGDVSISSGDSAPTTGGNSFAVKLHQASDVTLERVALSAGRGGSGYNGASGSGYSGSGNSGGNGGAGGSANNDGKNGGNGPGPCGSGGLGGDFPGAGKAGGTGCTGVNGGWGSGGSNAQPTLQGGVWFVPDGDGSNGLTGQPGGGGGGGGGGSGGIVLGTGDKGGSGGSGGRGGRGGFGGDRGGSSVALVVSSSNVVLEDSSLVASDAGIGGSGGFGAGGEFGYSGNSGGSSSLGFDGGPGGKGGRGGTGGRGGAGAGGNSVGVISGALASVQLTGSTMISVGSPGSTGGGGAGVTGFAGNLLTVAE